MNILLTGATGNLGTALIRSEAATFIPVGRVDWPQLHETLARGVDAVMHAAWDLLTPIAQHPGALLDANVMNTTRLLEACRDHGVRRFAFVSTCAVYGNSMITAESSMCCPVTVNGMTKLLNERIIEQFCAASGMDFQIYRVFNMYGGRDRFSVLRHIRHALENDTPFVLNNGGVAQRDFIHVDDVAKIIGALILRDLPGPHINVGTGRATRISDLVSAAQRVRPDLRITSGVATEAEYSRADIDLLTSVLGRIEFREVLEFVEESFRSPQTHT